MGATISSLSSRSSVFGLVASGDAPDFKRVPDVGVGLRSRWSPRPGQGVRQGVLVFNGVSALGHRESSACVTALVLDAERGLHRSRLPPFECVSGRGSLQASGDALNLGRITGRTEPEAHHRTRVQERAYLP